MKYPQSYPQLRWLRVNYDGQVTTKSQWQVERRERTRRLIELAGLVVKAGVVELTDDDRATLYGAFLTVSAKLRSEDRKQALMLRKRKGKRAFDSELHSKP